MRTLRYPHASALTDARVNHPGFGDVHEEAFRMALADLDEAPPQTVSPPPDEEPGEESAPDAGDAEWFGDDQSDLVVQAVVGCVCLICVAVGIVAATIWSLCR